jgi:riboflavin biosynthesis pyrimidine reductase
VSLELLWEHPGLPQQELPGELRDVYDGGLGFDGPCVYANFVQTLDGIVAIPELERSNALVADESDDDRLVMGILRAFADVVLVGTGTLLASPRGRWRPEGVYPAGKNAFAELRRRLGKPAGPAVAVVTTGASLDVAHPAVAAGAVVLTTTRGAERLAGRVPDLVPVNDGDRVDLRTALAVLRARGHSLVLSEAGPTTFGELVANRLVDDLFLTMSPVFAGRSGLGRLALVEGVELLPDARLAAQLASVRRSGNHLFLRYRL